jgi:hypothetical protein
VILAFFVSIGSAVFTLYSILVLRRQEEEMWGGAVVQQKVSLVPLGRFMYLSLLLEHKY